MRRFLPVKFTVGAMLIATGAIVCGPALAQGPTSASCAAVASTSNYYTFRLTDGNGNVAAGTIDFTAPDLEIHHNVALSINGGPTQFFDLVDDPCTNNSSGNAVFNLHPGNGSGGADLTDGDKWTFAIPSPLSTFAVSDTTNGSFQNPVTPGWTGSAASAPAP